ncbi:sulfur carrier protein ThiS [Microvirga sp. VF16]|uniref:sulfur carrier protein ThiS n=1 Tax=Microvirga sp. VF16 TaxID=2807101 RepID=UPI00193C8883|nr:sulfur carrier protein ThiS [Microvirga sp. VF16]QRM32325.1 sulfur carrier protein ThiS [Microvirga sp. VF16]
MKIILNGEEREIEERILSRALGELDFGDAVVATAVNERFVPASQRSAVALNDGDRLEVLAPMQGG